MIDFNVNQLVLVTIAFYMYMYKSTGTGTRIIDLNLIFKKSSFFTKSENAKIASQTEQLCFFFFLIKQ